MRRIRNVTAGIFFTLATTLWHDPVLASGYFTNCYNLIPTGCYQGQFQWAFQCSFGGFSGCYWEPWEEFESQYCTVDQYTWINDYGCIDGQGYITCYHSEPC
jgi:hypothetical protein